MTKLQNFLKSIPYFRKLFRFFKRQERLFRAQLTMYLCFEEHFNKFGVLSDYEFSLRVTDRNFNQVRLLEDVIIQLELFKVPGALVECGIFTGGASAYMLRSHMRHKTLDIYRNYWGFDSFEGMPHATVDDGEQAINWLINNDPQLSAKIANDGKLEGTNVNFADRNLVISYLRDTGYPRDKINLIQGWFQESIPERRSQIGDIALLRIDGDFYESTKVCLDMLGPSVVPNGVIIVDDYGSFEGCKKAVDEFVLKSPGFSMPFRYDAHQAMLIKIS